MTEELKRTIYGLACEAIPGAPSDGLPDVSDADMLAYLAAKEFLSNERLINGVLLREANETKKALLRINAATVDERHLRLCVVAFQDAATKGHQMLKFISDIDGVLEERKKAMAERKKVESGGQSAIIHPD
ncbi:MAG: hypothetical protein WCL08_00240 [Verrucomicrobiota bacterium]